MTPPQKPLVTLEAPEPKTAEVCSVCGIPLHCGAIGTVPLGFVSPEASMPDAIEKHEPCPRCLSRKKAAEATP